MKLMRQIRRTFSSGYTGHRDKAFNNPLTPFDFTAENYQQINKVLKKYPSNYKGSAVKALLYLAQDQNNNWIPLSAMRKIAKILEVPAIQVYEVATFYTMFNREPVGKFHLQMCGTTPCLVRGSRQIMQAVTEEVGIRVGETSEDGLFTMTEVECLGACVNAPMIQVNGKEVYEDLTPESMKNILRCFKEGKQVEGGPQISRNFSEGPMGRTNLQEIPDQIFCRDFDKLKAGQDSEVVQHKVEEQQKEPVQQQQKVGLASEAVQHKVEEQQKEPVQQKVEKQESEPVQKENREEEESDTSSGTSSSDSSSSSNSN